MIIFAVFVIIGQMYYFILFFPYSLIHGRLEDFYRVKLLEEVVLCTAVLATSHVWNMYMCISSHSDMHVNILMV